MEIREKGNELFRRNKIMKIVSIFVSFEFYRGVSCWVRWLIFGFDRKIFVYACMLSLRYYYCW